MFSYIIATSVIFAVGAIILNGLRRIESNPPHVALVTMFGERIKKVKKEGWRFFLFYPFLYGFIEIPVKKVDQDLPAEMVKTPDLADVVIPISLTWTPDYKNDPELLVTFLNNGGEAGVRNILEDIVRERLREWAFSNIEGPQNWKEAQAAQEEAIAVILKAVIGDALEHIPSNVPTSILLKYFNNPRKPLTDTEAGIWGKDFDKVREMLKEEDEEEVKKAITKRREDIVKARQGDSRFRLQQLGIVINRLNIGEIKPQGKIVEATEKLSQEQRERDSELFEVQTDLLKAQELLKQFQGAGEKATLDDAFRIIMEWKTTREGRGFTVPGIAPALTGLAKIFLTR